MTLDDFMAEARSLARPSAQYRFASGDEPISGYWHGVHEDGLCISIEREGRWLHVHLDGGRCRVDLSSEPAVSSQPLVRSDALSLPPIDAIFRFGSGAVATYLEACGWQRDWPFNGNFKGEAAHEYERAWSTQCPLYSDGIVAVAGGWNMPWPDDDWEDFLGHEFVLWTFEDAEPWVEVFFDGDRYTVMQRIT